MTYFSPDDVATVMHAVVGVDQSAATRLPDSIYTAALRFAHRTGLVKRTGQHVKITHAGRRYLRRYTQVEAR